MVESFLLRVRVKTDNLTLRISYIEDKIKAQVAKIEDITSLAFWTVSRQILMAQAFQGQVWAFWANILGQFQLLLKRRLHK